MSQLIDEFIKSGALTCTTQAKDDNWYITKPLDYFSFSRIKDAIRILKGKSFACHYKSDEF